MPTYSARSLPIFNHEQSQYFCVFKAEFSENKAYVVRLEAEDESDGTFTTIAAMQQIAATILPDLVPKTIKIRKETNFARHQVWGQLNAQQQNSVVFDLVEALKKLHCVRISDSWVKEILSKTVGADDEFLGTLEHPPVFDGPHTRFLGDGSTLLYYIIKRRELNHPFYTTDVISQEMTIKSSFEDLGSTVVTDNGMENWPKEAVFCHNDLTARNFILRSEATTGGELVYKLAGVIDWELAGFYPASYERSLQDTYLGADPHLEMRIHMPVGQEPQRMVLFFTPPMLISNSWYMM